MADEPTGNLDRANTERVLELLLRIQRERGMALVVVTHDQSVAARANRVLTVVDGILRAQGAPQVQGTALTTPGVAPMQNAMQNAAQGGTNA